MKPHRLSVMLEPKSVAYIGASAKSSTPGNVVIKMAKRGNFSGAIYPINPNYETIESLACYSSIHELPEAPDLAVLSVADSRVEAAFTDAIAGGAKSVLIFGGANLAETDHPKLPARLKAISREADIPLCGANCMGFYNLDHDLLATFHHPPYVPLKGHCTLITHSGSSWTSITHNDRRLGINLSVSTGQELTVSVADYMDYALDQPSTRVIGLILETIRDPDGFIAALEKANRLEIPVLALKVGRTQASAKLAVSHSGAIAGNDAVYEAVFDRYKVSRVDTLEQLAAGFSLLARYPEVDSGDLVSTHDSGFERELFVDLAEANAVRFADLSEQTSARLTALLDPGLEPINPLDVWGTGYDYQRVFTETFCALLEDSNSAVGVVAHSFRDGTAISDAWLDTAVEGARRTGKPVAMVTNFPWTRHPQAIERATNAGIPIIEGMRNGLVGVRCLLEQRDYRQRDPIEATEPAAPDAVNHWRQRLHDTDTLDEPSTLALLEAFGIRTTGATTASTRDEAIRIARGFNTKTALKTANPEIHHKTEVNGVLLDLLGDESVGAAYDDLSKRLGPEVSVAPMIEQGVEMSLGILGDRQFGPVVMIGAGGTLIELLKDRRVCLPPLDETYVERLIRSLSSHTLLQGHRGRPAVDHKALAHTAVRLGVLAQSLGDHIAELDINPLIVTPSGAWAVDALLVKPQPA